LYIREVEEGYSFPGGHAMVGLIMYGLMVYFIYHHAARVFVKKLALYTAITIMLWVGISRFALGEHYAPDVLASYSLGGFMLMLAIALHKHTYEKRR
jgi:membrane-associated phospholipid phosphatase